MTAVESSTCITHFPGLSIILRPAPELQGRPKDEQVPRCGDIVNAVQEMFYANKGLPFGLRDGIKSWGFDERTGEVESKR
jgi:hypothetical protein